MAPETAEFQPLALRALDQARHAGAGYADVRVVRHITQTVSMKNGVVEGVPARSSQGFGVRALVRGAWGIASSALFEPGEADRVADLAVRIARASARVAGREVRLAPAAPHVASYVTPLQVDPFTVSLDDKIALLLAADAAMRAVPGVTVAKGSAGCTREDKFFASTEGARIGQTLYESGAGIEATAIHAGEVQVRSYPNSFGRQMGTGGWELVAALDRLPTPRRRLSKRWRCSTLRSAPAPAPR